MNFLNRYKFLHHPIQFVIGLHAHVIGSDFAWPGSENALFVFFLIKCEAKGGELNNLNHIIWPTWIILERNPTFFSILSLKLYSSCLLLYCWLHSLLERSCWSVSPASMLIFLYSSLLFDEAIFILVLFGVLLLGEKRDWYNLFDILICPSC